MLIKILRNHVLRAADGTKITFFKQPRANVVDAAARVLIADGAAVALKDKSKSKPKPDAPDKAADKTPVRGKRSTKE